MAPWRVLPMQPGAEDKKIPPVKQEAPSAADVAADAAAPADCKSEATSTFAGPFTLKQLWDEHAKLNNEVAMLTRCLHRNGLLNAADEEPSEQPQPNKLRERMLNKDWMALRAPLARVMGFAGPAHAAAHRAACRNSVETVDQTREQAIVVFGGNSVSWPTSASQLLKSSECLQTQGDAWETLPDMASKRCAFASATLGGCIYVCGGGGHTALLSRTVSRFGTGSGSIRGAKWASVAPMGQPRTNFAMTAFAGRLYACGGFAGDSATNSAERYSPGCGGERKGSWQALPPMNSVRQGHAAVALDGQILVSGGSSGVPGKEKAESLLSSCEVYDPNGARWWQMPDLMFPRRSHTMVVLKKKAWVCGGLRLAPGSYLPVNSMEIFNPATQAWARGTPMMRPRQAHQSVVFAGRMYVLGGIAGSQSAERSVEVFDDGEGEAGLWRLAEPMVQERAAFVAATMLFDRIAMP